MRCRECGTEADGNYCPQCGAALREAERACDECGAPAEEGARYCTECGAALAGGPGKSWRAHLPWILSGLALAVFAVAITLFIQGQTSPRRAGGTMTGSLPGDEAPGEGRAAGGVVGDAGGTAAMPSAGELANMDPRTAADRLFDRTMRERAAGDTSRALFFARMARRAYARVPASEMDADAEFHVGLLSLAQGDTAEARRRAQAILAGHPDHLLGLVLAVQAAGSPERRRELEGRFLEALDGTALSSRPEYEAHRPLIEGAEAAARR